MTAPLTRMGLVVIACLIAVTGCTSAEKDPNMDYRQAREEIEDLLLPVQESIGGEWDPFDRGAGPCELPSGATGAEAPLARLGPGVPTDRREALVAEVTAAWSAAGFEPVRGEEPAGDGVIGVRLAYPASGVDEDGIYLALSFTEAGSSLEGNTRCVPGDSIEINEEASGTP